VKTTEQQAVGGPLSVLRDMRAAAREGRLVREEWDHDSPDYVHGRSNKRILIAGAALLGNKDLTMDEAWEACCEAAFGGRYR